MSATEHERTEEYRQIRLRGGDIDELVRVVSAFAAEDNEAARWYTDDKTLVLEHPLVMSLIGGTPYPSPTPEQTQENEHG